MRALSPLRKYRRLRCSAHGCQEAVEVDRRHVDNLTAAGGWWCHKHKRSA